MTGKVTRPTVALDSLPEEVRERVRRTAAAEPSLLSIATDATAAKRIERERRKAKHEERVATLIRFLEGRGIVAPVREWAFAQPAAGWLFDFAWPEQRVALEVDGGAFLPGSGRHGRGAGFREDLAKRNAALALGWRVVHVLPENVGKSDTAELVLLAHYAARGTPLTSPANLPAFILDDRQSARKAKRKPGPLPKLRPRRSSPELFGP